MASKKALPPQKKFPTPGAKRDLPTPSKKQEFGSSTKSKSSDGNQAAIERAKQDKINYDNEQSKQWDKTTREMKVPNVMYDDNKLAGKYMDRSSEINRSEENERRSATRRMLM